MCLLVFQSIFDWIMEACIQQEEEGARERKPGKGVLFSLFARVLPSWKKQLGRDCGCAFDHTAALLQDLL